MFTEGTKQFGIWRAGHSSLERYSGRPTQAILLAYGFCAFLTWLIFILTLKIRGDFFLIESMNVPLHEVSSQNLGNGAHLQAGLSVAVRSGGRTGEYRLVFDTGESFLLPGERKSVNEFIESRASKIELVEMLRKSFSPNVSTALLWIDKGVTLEEVQPLAKTLVNAGFDQLSFAVTPKLAEQLEAH